jgi:hypothetical protein
MHTDPLLREKGSVLFTASHSIAIIGNILPISQQIKSRPPLEESHPTSSHNKTLKICTIDMNIE